MKILYVTNVLPYPPRDGGKIRRLRLLQVLQQRHSVTFLGPAPDREALEEFQSIHPSVRVIEVPLDPSGRRVRIAEAARGAMSAETWDAVHVAELWQWPGERALGAVPCVLDSDNVESELLRRLGRLTDSGASELQAPVIRALELQAYRRADRVLACSEHDAELIRGIWSEARLALVPNGVDLEYFAYAPPANGPAIVTFTGLLSYRPNVDAVHYFVSEIWPRVRAGRPEAHFRIVGRYPAAEVLELGSATGVEVVPDVPDIRPHLAESSVMVVPLRAGSGTRLKILEAFAAGRPVVSTAIGAEGLGARHGEHLRIADTPEALAREIDWVLSRPAESAATAARARALAEREFGWEAIGEKLLAVYDGLGS